MSYYKLADGRLFRAEVRQPIGNDGRRGGEFLTSGSGIEFALRLARMATGRPES